VLLALKSMEAGLERIQMDTAAMASSLEHHWEVLGEAVQSLLRVRGVESAYSRMKSATRGLKMSADDYQRIVGDLQKIPESAAALTSDDFKRLRALTPASYTGFSAELAGVFIAAWRQRAVGVSGAEGLD
jgi:adenylosuccinate lyase